MKLTKKLLAILLAVSMLVGMVVISTSALQLDDAVESLTWDDCADINPETNPYTVKMGFKIYKVNTASGEYTLLEDTDPSNDTYDVAAAAGDVLRVETWAQTNFHTIGIQLAPAYSNAWLLPTTMSDYTVVATDASYPLKVAKAGDKTAMAEAFPKMVDFCDEYGTGDGTMENPAFITEALTQAKGQINHNSWSGLRGVLPKDWQGSGTIESKWINTSAKDQWGNSIVDAEGKLIYNVYQMGMGNNATGTEAWVGYGAILNVYQPVAVFNLTVAEGADGTAKIFYPLSSYYNTSNAYTQFTAVDYDAVQASPDGNGNWDESIPQVVAEGLTTYPNKVTYSDGTQADKNWIVTNATVTVDDGSGSEEPDTETTTETTTAALNYDKWNAAEGQLPASTDAYTPDSVAAYNTAKDAAVAAKDAAVTAHDQAALDSAAAALEAAVAKLVAKADKAALKAAIDTVVDTDNCTSDSIAKYEAALADANEVYADPNATQAAVDAAKDALVAAQNLQKLGKVNAAALVAAIAAYDELDKDAWTPNSWAASNVEALAAAAKEVDQNMYADEAGANQAAVDAAAKALNDAIAALVAVADKAALKAAIDTVVDTDNCTSDSIAKYEAALADAEAVYADPNATQAAVDAAKDALVAAQNLEKLGKVNAAALVAAIAAYDELDKNAWTPNSWTASNVEALAAAAKEVDQNMYADEAGANQAAVDAAAEALNDAIAALVAVADKEALAAAIAAAPTNEAGYTPETWAPFAEALAEANAVNADANATQDAVNAAVAALAEAQGNLAPVADKAALAEAIAAAKELKEENYTPESWAEAKLADAIAAAELVNDDANASDDEVSGAIAALQAAVEALNEKADTADLEEAIETLPAIAEEDATPETWAAYLAALQAAQAVFADPNATQEEVDKAEADLLAAIGKVAEKETVYCDYSDLDDAIAAFEEVNEDEYTPASYALVKEVYDAAKAVTRNMEYSEENQTVIDEAYDALTSAMPQLVKKADKTALKAAIDTVVDTANCTSASIAKYEEALADANEVYADANATQAAVDAATDALVAAQNLEKLPKVDYSDLIDAMEQYEAKNEADWTAETWAVAKAAYEAAAAILAEDLYDDEDFVNANRVNVATDDLLTALNRLEKAVDKTALKAEIDKEASIEEDLATDETWAEYANALANANDVYADDAATQEDVDDATAELAAANAALALRGLVNYDALDAALALVPAEPEDAYTAKTWAAYAEAKAAAEKVDRALVDNKAGTNQKLVDDAATALEEAYAALKINAANITNVEFDGERYYTPASREYAFTVNGAASKIQVLSPDGGTMTFDRRSSKVTIVSYNANGEVVDYADEDPAYEIWKITFSLKAGDYQARAKYDYTWDTEYYTWTVEYSKYDTAKASFTATSGDYVDVTEITIAKDDTITFTAVTDVTAIKIRFVFADGGTSTYSQGYSVDNGDGTRTWTVVRRLSKAQDIDLMVKAPTGWGAEPAGTISLSIAK